MKSQAFITDYDLVTPFGLGLSVNYNSILDNLSALDINPFPWNSMGFDPDKSVSKNYFVIEKLFDSLRSSLENQKLDAILFLNSHFTLEEVVTKLKGKSINNFQGYHKTFYTRDHLVDLVKKYQISCNPDNFYEINNTCTTGISLLGFAEQGIAQKKWNRVLAIAIDLEDTYSLISLTGLGALSPTHESKPFDRNRNGFVKTSGAAAALILSKTEFEKSKSHLPPIGICKFSQTSDAYRLTDGRDDALGAIRAMKQSIERSGLQVHDIDFVKSHGTGTFLNDSHESLAIQTVFQSSAKIPVTSLKGHLGHTTDASGLIETLLAGYAFNKNTILPIRNLESTDFKLNFVKSPLRIEDPKYFISSNLGFGGNNSSIIIEKI